MTAFGRMQCETALQYMLKYGCQITVKTTVLDLSQYVFELNTP